MTDPVLVLREALDKATEGPWMVSDCEGSLSIWREGALRHVHRNESGEIDGYSMPSSYVTVDQVAAWDLDTWDEGEDELEDQLRSTAHFIVAARNLLPVLLDEVEALRKVVDGVKALHVPWYEVNGVRYEMRAYSNEAPEGHVCVKPGESPYGDECNAEEEAHYVLACAECRCVVEDGEVAGYWLWPCDTARLLAVLDKEEAK